MKPLKHLIFLSLLFIGINTYCQNNEYILITNGKVNVAVDIKSGGRIMEYSLNGNNVLFRKSSINSDFKGPDGGRCDFGPEKLVPNRDETWLGEWELLEKRNNYIKIKSQVAKNAGVQLIREFKIDPSSSHLAFKQTIINISDTLKRYCHWSRTFGELNGICLAPLNPNSRFPNGYMVYTGSNQLDYAPKGGKNERIREGILEILGPPENAKIVTDGSEGWLAYLTKDNQLFIKKFEVFPDKIYGEMTGATVSIWYNKDGVCEIEPIGPWEWIEPAKSISFTENWYLTEYTYPKNRKSNLSKIRSIVEKL